MARRHSTDPIPPFPSDVDRFRFGDWLSGFTDGEGSFNLYWAHKREKRSGWGRFVISLRDDDAPILRKIRSFFQCGQLHARSRRVDVIRNGKPALAFEVQDMPSLANIVVPHFENHPLQAKKQRDFEIWKVAIRFIYQVHQRKMTSNGNGRVFYRKWSAIELEDFGKMHDALRVQRAYESASVIVPPPKPSPKPTPLFDGLD